MLQRYFALKTFLFCIIPIYKTNTFLTKLKKNICNHGEHGIPYYMVYIPNQYGICDHIYTRFSLLNSQIKLVELVANKLKF